MFAAPLIHGRFALDGSPYSITFFLGDVPEHSAYNFADDLTAIGRVYNFSSQAEGRGVDESGCGNFKKQRDEHALFTGQVILTDYLIERIILGQAQRGLTLTSLDEDEVVNYLRTNLHWRITDVSASLMSRRIELTPSVIDQRRPHSKRKYAVAKNLGSHGSRDAFLGGE